MRDFLKGLLKKMVSGGAYFLNSNNVGRFIQDEIVNNAMQLKKTVRHNGFELNFSTPNRLNYFRADSFSTKEPETLEWIDSLPQGSIVWDVGANIGLYSCYAARSKGCRVYAFEPSVFNLELLARNIFINDLMDSVCIVPLPLSDGLKVSSLNMSTTEWGGSLSTFDQSYTHDGKELIEVFKFQTIGLTMSDAVRRLQIPNPDFIKMDVDGIEHLILGGGGDVLSGVQGILVEVNEDYEEQEINVKEYLTQAGLVMKEKRHSEMIENSSDVCNTYNQIWWRTANQA